MAKRYKKPKSTITSRHSQVEIEFYYRDKCIAIYDILGSILTWRAPRDHYYGKSYGQDEEELLLDLSPLWVPTHVRKEWHAHRHAKWVLNQ